jgi:hypothetical protein
LSSSSKCLVYRIAGTASHHQGIRYATSTLSALRLWPFACTTTQLLVRKFGFMANPPQLLAGIPRTAAESFTRMTGWAGKLSTQSGCERDGKFPTNFFYQSSQLPAKGHHSSSRTPGSHSRSDHWIDPSLGPSCGRILRRRVGKLCKCLPSSPWASRDYLEQCCSWRSHRGGYRNRLAPLSDFKVCVIIPIDRSMMECACEALATEHRADNIEAVKLFIVEDYIENFRG